MGTAEEVPLELGQVDPAVVAARAVADDEALVAEEAGVLFCLPVTMATTGRSACALLDEVIVGLTSFGFGCKSHLVKTLTRRFLSTWRAARLKVSYTPGPSWHLRHSYRESAIPSTEMGLSMPRT